MIKKAIIVLILLLTSFGSQSATATPSLLNEAVVAKVFPEKTAWIGQKVTFFLPKLHERTGFSYIYPDPVQYISVHDQYLLSKKLDGKSFIVQGLYGKEGKSRQYYWKLNSVEDGSTIWVLDSNFSSDEIPFSLPDDIQKEIGVAQALKSMLGKTVWYNANSNVLGKQAGHLEPLVLNDIIANRPYSKLYTVIFKQQSEATIQWVTGYSSNPPVYSDSSLQKVLGKYFYAINPRETYPNWTDEDWNAIAAKEIRTGWIKEKVFMSWGSPKKYEIEADNKLFSDRWVYEGDVNLLFKRGVLVKILVPQKPVAEKVSSPPGKDDKQKIKPEDRFKNYIEVAQSVKR